MGGFGRRGWRGRVTLTRGCTLRAPRTSQGTKRTTREQGSHQLYRGGRGGSLAFPVRGQMPKIGGHREGIPLDTEDSGATEDVVGFRHISLACHAYSG